MALRPDGRRSNGGEQECEAKEKARNAEHRKSEGRNSVAMEKPRDEERSIGNDWKGKELQSSGRAG